MTAQHTDELLEDVRRKLEDSQDAFNLFRASHMFMAAEGPKRYTGELENVRDKFVDLWDAFGYLEMWFKAKT